MTREEFIKQYPTPEYVKAAREVMHHMGLTNETMLAWENACYRARYEADRAYEKEYPA